MTKKFWSIVLCAYGFIYTVAVCELLGDALELCAGYNEEILFGCTEENSFVVEGKFCWMQEVK